MCDTPSDSGGTPCTDTADDVRQAKPSWWSACSRPDWHSCPVRTPTPSPPHRRRGWKSSVFALASTACGAAVIPATLVSGRFVQGVGEALAAPASLGLIAVLFPDPRERIKALGVWGGLTGLGGVSGAVISGALTDLTSWRWIFFINLPIALIALVMVPRLVSESKMVRAHHRLDFAGALTATGGLVAVVDGLLQAASHPCGSWQVLLPLIAGALLLTAMVVVEGRSQAPLIPLQFFDNRTRVVANFITLFNTSAFMTYVYLLTLFEQQVLGYSPLEGGLSYLPLGFGIGAGIGLGTALMPRTGVKPLLSVGFLGGAVGLLLTGGVHVGSSYVGGVLPGMILLALSSGLTFPAITNAALHQVTSQDSGLGSGIQSAMQAVGGALGLACLVTLALRHSLGEMRNGVATDVAATHGCVLGFRVGAALLLGVVMARRRKRTYSAGEASRRRRPTYGHQWLDSARRIYGS